MKTFVLLDINKQHPPKSRRLIVISTNNFPANCWKHVKIIGKCFGVYCLDKRCSFNAGKVSKQK